MLLILFFIFGFEILGIYKHLLGILVKKKFIIKSIIPPIKKFKNILEANANISLVSVPAPFIY